MRYLLLTIGIAAFGTSGFARTVPCDPLLSLYACDLSSQDKQISLSVFEVCESIFTSDDAPIFFSTYKLEMGDSEISMFAMDGHDGLLFMGSEPRKTFHFSIKYPPVEETPKLRFKAVLVMQSWNTEAVKTYRGLCAATD